MEYRQRTTSAARPGLGSPTWVHSGALMLLQMVGSECRGIWRAEGAPSQLRLVVGEPHQLAAPSLTDRLVDSPASARQLGCEPLHKILDAASAERSMAQNN